MKKSLLSLILILLTIIISVGWVSTAHAQEQEVIQDFAVSIQINQDTSINVEETIVYDFGAQQRHGIYRNIPYKYKARGGNYSLDISDVKVSGDSGRAIEYSTSRSGGYLKLKIGDPNTYVTGQQVYKIYYTVDKAVNFFENHDELYWNITGNEWIVPITKASANVFSPNVQANRVECFTGSYGSTNSQCSKVISGSNVSFETNQSLNEKEGLTIVVGYPKGYFLEPTKQQLLIEKIKDNGILVLPVIVFVFLFWLWKKIGKDPDMVTVVPQYEAPENFSPAEILFLQGGAQVMTKLYAAQIIYLATKGYLKITRQEKEGWFGGEDFVLDKNIGKRAEVEADNKLLGSIFAQGNMVSLSSFKGDRQASQKFLEVFGEYRKNFEKLGYFRKNTRGVGGFLAVLGIFSIIGSIMLGIAFENLFLGLAVGASGLLFILFGIIMPARTKEGVEVYAKVLGLKKYIEVAEQDRINFHDAPEKSPEHFQKLLPFAILFGLEKKWAEKFEGMNVQPDWYTGSPGTVFSAAAFSNSMSNFASAAGSSMVTAASGGSGFSGGRSGGGGGGGGGGSW